MSTNHTRNRALHITRQSPGADLFADRDPQWPCWSEVEIPTTGSMHIRRAQDPVSSVLIHVCGNRIGHSGAHNTPTTDGLMGIRFRRFRVNRTAYSRRCPGRLPAQSRMARMKVVACCLEAHHATYPGPFINPGNRLLSSQLHLRRESRFGSVT